MRIFVFESLSAGPLASDSVGDDPAALAGESLAREGWTMLRALAVDLAAIDGMNVVSIVADPLRRDSTTKRWQIERASTPVDRTERFDHCAAAADATILIAPEIDGQLARLARRVADVGGKLLGPSIESVELASDKHRTATLLGSRDTPVPRGTLLEPGPLDRAALAEFPFPAVAKPLDGAGSFGVQLVRSADELAASPRPRRLEAFVPGVAASVAALCGPSERRILPPCTQRLSTDGRFSYLGGTAPLPPQLAERAKSLAAHVLAALPGLAGYIGIDLVLGERADGSADAMIEVNPRLTTSYVGLRRLAESNLAAALVQIALGRAADELRFRPGRVEFDCRGAAKYFELPESDFVERT
ncbi:MAG: hypothetical protein DCC68_06070 [Planctomycetota bacterium]|nr:MAG: hypothetical protein DCC68_06070 [Planctomycetota bacterium]